MADSTRLGALLEDARTRLGLSVREAARRADISEARWRQIERGFQRIGDVDVPVNPRRQTVIMMATVVGVPAEDALRAAGFKPKTAREVFEIADAVERTARSDPRPSTRRQRIEDQVEALIEEIYADDRIPEERKSEMVRGLRRAEAERQAVQDELNRWRRAG